MTTSGEEEEDIAGGDDGGNEDEGRDVHMLDTQPVLMLGRGERGWERGEGGEVRTGRWCERDSSPTNPIVPHPLSAPPSPPPHPEDEIYMAATQVVDPSLHRPPSSTISGVDTTTAGAAGLGGDVAAPSPAIGLPDAAISPGGAQAAEAPPSPAPSPASNTSPAPVSGAAFSPPPPPLAAAAAEAQAQLGTIGHPAPASGVDGPSLAPGAAITTTAARRPRHRYIPGADGGPPAPIPGAAIVPAPVFNAAPSPVPPPLGSALVPAAAIGALPGVWMGGEARDIGEMW